MGPMDAIGNWGVLRLERQKYLSVKIVDKANDKRERRQNKRAIFPDVSQFDILRDFGPGPEDPFCDLPFAENYKLCAHCAYVIEFESGQAQPLKNTKKKKNPTQKGAEAKKLEHIFHNSFHLAAFAARQHYYKKYCSK